MSPSQPLIQAGRKVQALLLTTLLVSTFAMCAADPKNLGYSDTPILPGQKWRVHDGTRPQPRVVTPGKAFSHGAQTPSDATILFDGSDLSKWTGQGGKASWKIENGYMEVNGTGGIQTRDQFGDFQLHLEFATPSEVKGSSQGRGNSGVIVYGIYEIQVLDSFDNPTYPDGQAGSLYGQFPPLVNASKAPGEWQTFDIIFETPRWDDSKNLLKAGNTTVIHNGVILHHKKEFIGPVQHRGVKKYSPHPPQGSIHLQDHGNPMRFRNIWIRNLGDYDQP